MHTPLLPPPPSMCPCPHTLLMAFRKQLQGVFKSQLTCLNMFLAVGGRAKWKVEAETLVGISVQAQLNATGYL